MPVRRGAISWVESDPAKGSERDELGPALIVQNDLGSRHSPTTVVVAITRTLSPEPYPFVVVVEPENSGLPERSAINCSQIATIQQAGPESRLRPPRGESAVRPLGSLSADRMAQVGEALRYSLAPR